MHFYSLQSSLFPIALLMALVGFVEPVAAQSSLWVEDENPFSNLAVFAGLEGSKQPQDFGVNAHFGGRTAISLGMPLWQEWGLGLQVGTSLNATANAVQVVERTEGTSGRTQNFTTVGLFQRFESGLIWGVGYDFLYQDYYDKFSLGQWRGKLGYFLNENNEIGVQTALRDRGDSGTFTNIPVHLQPISQGSVYFKHTFSTQATLGCWAGVAGSHGEANYALGDLPRTDNVFAYGCDVYIPLNNYFALTGEANFLTPADTGTVDAFLGLELRPFGGAMLARRNRYAPVLSTANNTTMSVDLQR